MNNNSDLENKNQNVMDENGNPVQTEYVDEMGNPIDPSLIDANGNYIGSSVEYVDENGNPIDPSLIDANGNYIGGSENKTTSPTLPSVNAPKLSTATIEDNATLKDIQESSTSAHQMDNKEMLSGMVTFDYNNVPITDIVNSIILDAINKGASDIHFDPIAEGIKIRIRVDGVLHDYSIVPLYVKKNMITRIKIISSMNITESRMPQDGAIRTELADKTIDLRVACLPTNKGEKIVVRIMDYSMSVAGVEGLDFSPDNLKKVKKMLSLPNGIILVTGATGTGKSTTVYSMLQVLNKEGTNIITVEDPIEMNIGGINQVQAQEEIGLNFATVLRSILREDPDVIMIGEIRDDETARIAIRASITGHLVLSTIHTNNSLNTIERLTDMSVERYLLGSSLSGIISQKLARRICPDCREKRPTTEYEKKVFKEALNKDVNEIYVPKGCPKCSGGYRGRIAIHEVLLINQSIRDAITNGMDKASLRKLVYGSGETITMLQDGLQKVLLGETSFDEILKLIDLDDDLGKDTQLGLANQLEESNYNNIKTQGMFNPAMMPNMTPEIMKQMASTPMYIPYPAPDNKIQIDADTIKTLIEEVAKVKTAKPEETVQPQEVEKQEEKKPVVQEEPEIEELDEETLPAEELPQVKVEEVQEEEKEDLIDKLITRLDKANDINNKKKYNHRIKNIIKDIKDEIDDKAEIDDEQKEAIIDLLTTELDDVRTYKGTRSDINELLESAGWNTDIEELPEETETLEIPEIKINKEKPIKTIKLDENNTIKPIPMDFDGLQIVPLGSNIKVIPKENETYTEDGLKIVTVKVDTKKKIVPKNLTDDDGFNIVNLSEQPDLSILDEDPDLTDDDIINFDDKNEDNKIDLKDE